MEEKGHFFSELMSALSLMMDLNENRKLYHAWRVALVSERMAQEILPEYSAHIFFAGMLHDIGAISLPDHVTHYTDIKEHFDNPILFNHPEKGAKIVSRIPSLAITSDMILHHHEQWDGSGYPKGMNGDSISIGGQILRIADTFDILTRVRPPLSIDGMKTALEARVNSEFSSIMYELLMAILNEGTFFEDITDDIKLSKMVLSYIKKPSPMDLSYCDVHVNTTVKIFAEVIDAKHSYTAGHSERVANYTYLIAKAMGFNDKDAEKFKKAAYLHDAGKVAIPKEILDKPSPLTLEEFKSMRKHPVYTMEILSMVSSMRDLVPIAGGHHERYDGSGYPDGESRDRIPIGARIMAVADSYDAMTSRRPYQTIKNTTEAKEEIIKNAGGQFDPEVTQVAVKILP